MKRKPEKKKRKLVRNRSWEDAHETAFTHDRAKHRRAQFKLSDTAIENRDVLLDDFTPNAMVICHSKKWAFVMHDSTEKLCQIDERLEERDTTLLAPGDRVFIEESGSEWWVRGVSPRRSYLARLAGQHARVETQILAANVDLLIIVASAAKPPFRPGLIDRYLITAELGNVTPILCVNKIDLVENIPDEITLYQDLNIEVFTTSCDTGAGIAELKARLHGQTNVLAGHSGVGKSSLLNAMDPELELHTRTISEATQRGKHTTTAARLYEIDGDIHVIDTPGIRSLGLWGISPEEVAYYFPEIADHAQQCRFRNCTHTHEPDCGVLAASEAGDLPEARLKSYLRIRASLESDTGTTPGRMTAKYQGNRG